MRSKSAFLRQMIIAGFVYDVDYSYLREYNYLLGKVGVSLNQIAKRANETRSICQADTDEIKGEMEKLWKVQSYAKETAGNEPIRGFYNHFGFLLYAHVWHWNHAHRWHGKTHRNIQRKCRRERNYVEHKKITYYDDPRDNTAFERCVDVMSRLMLKYGPNMLGEIKRKENGRKCKIRVAKK